MHLLSCQSPKKITNPYTNEDMIVGCGKCPSCLSRKSVEWVSRLEQERKCWPFTVFFTLTYADRYLPKMYYDKESDCLVDKGRLVRFLNSKGQDFEYRESSGLCVPMSELRPMSDKDFDYLKRRPWISYNCTSDFQKFIKRFRYYAKKIDKNCVVRYFISSEFGPTTFRIHAHGLIFFDSVEVSKHISEILRKSWRLSDYDTDWKFVESSAASYVSSYTSFDSNLPAFLRHRYLRPVKIFSKSPCIGTLFYSKDQVRRLVDSSSCLQSVPKSNGVEYCTIPLWRTFKDRLFPKQVGYSRLSVGDRKLLYGLASGYETFSFNEFLNVLHDYETCGLFYNLHKFRRLGEISSDLCWNDDTLHRVFNISKRVIMQARIFNMSLDYYVQKIFDFYEKKEKLSLCNQLQFEEQNYFDLKKLICLDPIKVDSLRSAASSGRLSEADNLLLDSFGLSSLDILDDSLIDVCSSEDYSLMSAKHNKIYLDSHKNKAKKDYICKHPELKDFYYECS